MNILTVGDSFTFGEELEDRTSAWPQQLANRLGAHLVNRGEPSAGNTRILRNAIQHITSASEAPVDMVFVGWSNPGRIEFSDAAGTYDVWPGYGGRMFAKHGATWRHEILDYINRYHNPEYLFQQYLINVISLQSFLKTRNIRYVMANIQGNDYYTVTCYPKFAGNLAMAVDTQHFLGWPDTGMVEWSWEAPRGEGGHPLEQGHKLIADKFYEHIRNIGWVS